MGWEQAATGEPGAQTRRRVESRVMEWLKLKLRVVARMVATKVAAARAAAELEAVAPVAVDWAEASMAEALGVGLVALWARPLAVQEAARGVGTVAAAE